MSLVAAHFNVGWDYSDGRIRIRRTITRTFTVPALPIISDLSFTLDSGGESESGGSGEGGGATSEPAQSATTTSSFDVWRNIKVPVDTIVGTDQRSKLGRVTVWTTVTNAHLVCTLLLDKIQHSTGRQHLAARQSKHNQ